MAFTFKELKQLKNDIAAAMGIDSSIAARVIGYYNGGGRPDVVRAMMGGDLSHVGPALVALGITPENITDITPDSVHTSGSASADDLQADNITAGSDMVPDGVGDDLHAAPDGFQNAPQKTKKTQADKRTTKQKKTNTSPQAVKGPEGVHDDLGPDDIEIVGDFHELPPGLHDDICAIIDGFADSHGIQDKQKIHPLQFGAACTLVGMSIKKRGILLDVERNKREGGVKYDPHKVLALLYLYEYICSCYKQVPFSHNFPKFAGVSREYFNDYAKQGLTSSHLAIAQKAHEIQRAGLVDAVNGGGSATVGNIFLSKALAGLQETVTIQHVSAASTPAAVALPVFGPDGGLLEDKRPE